MIKSCQSRKSRSVTSLGYACLILTVLSSSIYAFKNWQSYKAHGKKLERQANQTLKYVKRENWMAQPAAAPLIEQVMPLHKVIISHTATDECKSKDECSNHVRTVQAFHMEYMHWDDIAFNFLIGGDGLVYIGRGWNKQGAHTKGNNVGSVGIAFIGTFATGKPSNSQLKAAKTLIKEGARLGKLDLNYSLYGSRQFAATDSPGEELYKIIKTWPHWKGENLKTTFKIITRAEWLAQPSSTDLAELIPPIKRIVVVPKQTKNCTSVAQCIFHVRYLQTFHMESLKEPDIQYNFLIGGDDNVYEGRGWNYKGSNFQSNNNDSISIAYIGSFDGGKLSTTQIDITKFLLEVGIHKNILDENLKIVDAAAVDSASGILPDSFTEFSHKK